MRKFPLMQKAARVAFAVLVVAMLFLFFSNDFGLVDIHKASIVVAVGVDVTENGYEVTAQAAVPTPAQSGSNEQYTRVTGSGATVADAVDDINAKTGFYPKLAFCNIVVLGESCAKENIFTVLDYFYRNDYVPLTALVSMCGGSAKDLLGKKPSDGSMSASRRGIFSTWMSMPQPLLWAISLDDERMPAAPMSCIEAMSFLSSRSMQHSMRSFSSNGSPI